MIIATTLLAEELAFKHYIHQIPLVTFLKNFFAELLEYQFLKYSTSQPLLKHPVCVLFIAISAGVQRFLVIYIKNNIEVKHNTK